MMLPNEQAGGIFEFFNNQERHLSSDDIKMIGNHHA